MSLLNGTELAGYRIEGVLGRGGMGEVYEATQLSLGRTVALKVLRADLGADLAFRERFRREGRIQAGLDHPNIVTVHEAGELPGTAGLFLAMRLVRGSTLKDLIRSGELDAGRALHVLGPVAAALDAAHAAGLTHRDVKPQNILIAAGDHPFLADFGLTRSADDTALTRSGAFMGTIDYVAPEIIRGEPAGPASDVYALACVAFECLSGAIPFPREAEAAALYAHVNEVPAPFAAARGLPAGVDAVLAQGMAKEQDERPPTAGALIDALAAAVGGAVVAPHTPGPPRGAETIVDDPSLAVTPQAARASEVTGRGRSRARLAGACLLVALLAGGAFAAGHKRAKSAPDALITRASGVALELRAPTLWAPASARAAPAIPKLPLRDGVAFFSPEPRAGLNAGMTDATGPALLPARFQRTPRKRGDVVQLGAQQALRYRDVSVKGFPGTLTLYAVPTTNGVATIACYRRSTTPKKVVSDCERSAATLELHGRRAVSVKPDPKVAGQIDHALAAIEQGRLRAGKSLNRAKSRSAQETAARRLAIRNVNGALALRLLRVSPAIEPAVTAIADAAASAAITAGQLRSAAAAGDAGAFARAGARLAKAQRRFRARVLDLRRAGYAVG